MPGNSGYAAIISKEVGTCNIREWKFFAIFQYAANAAILDKCHAPERILSSPTPVTTSSAVLGQTLIALRKAKGMTQGQVAEAMGMSSSNWSRAEKGESSLTVDQLRMVSRVLETTPEKILNAADAAEQEAINKGLKVIPGTVAGATLGSAIAGDSTKGAAAGVSIPVVGAILGALIGTAILAYLSGPNGKGK